MGDWFDDAYIFGIEIKKYNWSAAMYPFKKIFKMLKLSTLLWSCFSISQAEYHGRTAFFSLFVKFLFEFSSKGVILQL